VRLAEITCTRMGVRNILGCPFKKGPQDRSTIKLHCFWVEEVVVFVPSLCWVVVLLLDCPV
jgi:hypothetical protein